MTIKQCIVPRSRAYCPPENWEREKKEIHNLLRSFDPEYRKRRYLSPNIYISAIREKKKEYPIMSAIVPTIQKRHIGYFLKEQGRVKRSGNRAIWELPDKKEETYVVQ